MDEHFSCRRGGKTLVGVVVQCRREASRYRMASKRLIVEQSVSFMTEARHVYEFLFRRGSLVGVCRRIFLDRLVESHPSPCIAEPTRMERRKFELNYKIIRGGITTRTGLWGVKCLGAFTGA